jgi:hypothetical protein
MSGSERTPVDSSTDGTIVNPQHDASRTDAGDEAIVGDDADQANDRRFSEEQQLIEQQVRPADSGNA